MGESSFFVPLVVNLGVIEGGLGDFVLPVGGLLVGVEVLFVLVEGGGGECGGVVGVGDFVIEVGDLGGSVLGVVGVVEGVAGG